MWNPKYGNDWDARDHENFMITSVVIFLMMGVVVLVVNSDDRLPISVQIFQGGEIDPGLSGEVYQVIDTSTGEYHSREWYLENRDQIRVTEVIQVAPPHMRAEGGEPPGE